MKATALEFRMRMMINLLIIVFGFNAPGSPAWSSFAPVARKPPVLEWLPLQLSHAGLVSFAAGVPLAIVTASLLAGAGAILRIWGSAWLGPSTVTNAQMQAGFVMANGPYRYVRNPLYIGVWCMVAALAFLMQPIGALVSLVLITLFQLRLILGEEAFLSGRLGAPYQAYLRTVPRLVPRLRGAPAPTGRQPHWLRAALTELTPMGIFLAFAFLSWSYDYWLMARVIVVSFGVGLLGRALMLNSGKEPAAIN